MSKRFNIKEWQDKYLKEAAKKFKFYTAYRTPQGKRLRKIITVTADNEDEAEDLAFEQIPGHDRYISKNPIKGRLPNKRTYR